MKLKQCVARLVLIACTICCNGCALFLIGAGVAIGAGTVKYIGGELQAADEVTMGRAWNASLRAMQDLEFKVTKSQKDALAGEIVARRADGAATGSVCPGRRVGPQRVLAAAGVAAFAGGRGAGVHLFPVLKCRRTDCVSCRVCDHRAT